MTDEPIKKARSLWGEAWVRLRRNRLAMVSLAVIVVFVGVGLMDFVPMTVEKHDGSRQRSSFIEYMFHVSVGATNKEESYVPPMTTGREFLQRRIAQEKERGRATAHLEAALGRATGLHVLGTNIAGDDLLMLTLRGINTAVILGVGTALISIPLGLLLGIVAGYFGGRVDDAIVYVYSTLACVPGILLLIALMHIMHRGLVQLCIALGVTGWVGLCRLIRGQTLSVREQEYVLAARALGAGHSRIILRHIMPNLFHIVIITFTLAFGGIVMSEAVLSYLGLGVGTETASWGRIIQGARMELSRTPSVWWPLSSAAGALLVLVLAFNIFGDALRDALDPRLKNRGGGA
jgi:peptide/nickel transport system permease protein